MALSLGRSIGILVLVGAGALVPARAAEVEDKCVLSLMGNIPFAFTGPSLVPTFDGSINGVPTRVHFDLTSYDTHLNRSALEKMGIKSGNSYEKISAIGGSAKIYTAYVKELRVGPVKDSGRFEVWDQIDDSVGILAGTDFLLRRDLEISFAGRYLKFFKPVNCRDDHLAYWDANAISLPFWTAAGNYTRPHIKVKVNGIEMEAVLSSTIANSIISTSAARKFGITPDSPGVVGNGEWQGPSGKPQPQWKVPVAAVEVGEEKIANSTLVMHELGGLMDVILARDFLQAHRILISTSQQKIYLSYTGGAVFSNTDITKQPWFKTELKDGNPDALYWMAKFEENRSSAIPWFEKAASKGHPGALMEVGQERFAEADFSASLKMFREGMAVRPSYSFSLWRYLAAARVVGNEQALTQLMHDRALLKTDSWNVNLVDFHLGKLDAAQLNRSSQDREAAKGSTCDVEFNIAQSYLLKAQTDLARRFLESTRNVCDKNKVEYRIAEADLARLAK